MVDSVSIVLVAVGGYGNHYVRALLDAPDRSRFRITGVVDPFAEGCRRLDELRALQIPFFPTLEEFYAEYTADLAVISSPIHLHCPQTCAALEHGTSVLCEKPFCATVQEAAAMRKARDISGCFVSVGYQWSFSKCIRELKKDVLDGRYGRLLRAKTILLWPRDYAYYNRNDWAGALQDSAGNWILDSPVNNATAHYLHNMLYVPGDEADRSIRPVTVTAELYRANAITNYDTGVARIKTAGGSEMLYIATHAVKDKRGPEFLYEFEKGTVRYSDDSDSITGHFSDGTVRDYGDPGEDLMSKLWNAIAAVRGEGISPCGPEAAGVQTLVINGMQESAERIVDFPSDLVAFSGESGSRVTYARGLGDLLGQCYEQFKLPSEVLSGGWTHPGTEVDLTGYDHFPRNA